MKKKTIQALLCSLSLAIIPMAVKAADQFVKVANPGWTNSSQYSWTGVWGDYDNDGFIDLFVPNSTATWTGWTNFLYHNNGDGTFTRKSAAEVGTIASDRDMSLGGYWGDFNNDGYLDLLVINDPQSGTSINRLYLNRGNGTFASVNAGDLSKPYYPAAWGSIADYDRDGFLDVFVCAAYSVAGHQTNLLFRGRGDGTFSSVTTSPLATDQSPYSNDVSWGDFNNDGNPDLIVANWDTKSFVYRNDGHGQFTRLTNSILENYVSGHNAWGDYNNDGFLDLASGSSSALRLFQNNGGTNFVLSSTWAFEGYPAWEDYDNDGYLDLVMFRGQGAATNLWLLHNNGDGTFTQVEEAFTRITGHWLAGAWGDYDNDGFMDLFAAEETGKNLLSHNLGNTNHWIKFKLEGVASNRSAIGAKVRIKATIRGKSIWQMREVSGGNFGQNDLRPNFGLGDATNVDLVRIEWPSGNGQEFPGLTADKIITITESAAITPARPSASLNGSVTLTRTAVAGATYQWQFEGADVIGQTNRTLNLTNILASQQGHYSIVVSNATTLVTNYVYLFVDSTFTKITTGSPVTDLGINAYGAAGDYDGDGFPDLFVARYTNGRSALYRNNGDGTFTTITNAPFAQKTDAWITGAWADLDNDGRLDLVTARTNKPAIVYFNNGDGTFNSVQLAEVAPNNVALMDFNRDGLLDIVLCGAWNWNSPAPAWFYRNNGDRTFTRVSINDVGPIANFSASGGTFADYDDDGSVDLFCANFAGSSQLFHNDGTGRFVSNPNVAFQSRVSAGAWGDYDNDGRLDLCVASLGGTTFVYHNLGR